MAYRQIKKYAFAYLSLPLLVFLLGYLKWYFGVPLALIVVFALYCAMKEANVLPERAQEISVSPAMMLSLGVLILIWSYLGGLNGHFYQSSDWGWRNAIFHDMIDYPWAVRYPNGNALNYYIGFWLVPALFAKLGALLTGSRETAWEIARNALWLWSAAGLYLTVLLIIIYNRASGKKQQLLSFLFFAFFSGLDILGALHYHQFFRFNPGILHLDRWANTFQYSSITTCLYWVFNQTVLSWLAVMCFLFEKDEKNYLLIGLACFVCGPLPFVGLAILMASRAIIRLARNVREGNTRDSLRAAFSTSNMLLILTGFPVIALFFLSNSAVNANASRTRDMLIYLSDSAYLKRLVVFCALEFVVYVVLLWKRHARDPLFYAIAISLMIIPNIYVGPNIDFCMRASIPGILVLCVYFSEYVLEQLFRWKEARIFDRACCTALLIVFLIGAATPSMEIYRGLYYVVTEKTVELEDNSVGSVSQTNNGNCIAFDCKNMFFFQYLAR